MLKNTCVITFEKNKFYMKRLLFSLFAAAFVFFYGSTVSYAEGISFGSQENFGASWLFHLGDVSGAEKPGFEDASWQEVDIPHDWSVKGRLSPDLASCTGYLPAGIGWYRKHFDGEALASVPKVYVYFEGVYNRSSVYLNGNLLGYRPNGYNSFAYDLTPYLNKNGENVLAVKVDHSRVADSRWYTGSGIYRDVYLVKASDVHFAKWGVGYVLKSVEKGRATVAVDVKVEGLEEFSEKGFTLKLNIRDAEGKEVVRTTKKLTSEQTLSLKISKPNMWNLDSPYLYSLNAEILDNRNKIIDFCTIPMGLRELQFDPDKGFFLNGKNMKIKGVCLHHDAGVLGSAVPVEVLERRLCELKALGVNAIRTSHNPQSPVFYDLCDRIGLLVMDEAFDEWEFPKRKWVDGWNVGEPAYEGTFDFFEEWGEKDLRDMVLRDRNHPSVFLWSIGNEVDYPNDPYSHPVLDGGNSDFSQPAYGGYKPDAPNAMRIGEIAERFATVVRSCDTSRPVTGALAGVVMSNQTAYPGAVDVVGYNYTESRYTLDHKAYPNRIIYGSENGHSYEAWKAVKDNDFISGQFLWTGTDYLGESRAWPSRGFYSGLLDFGNFVKPRGWFRASLWADRPVCYLGTSAVLSDTIDAWDDWNYATGQTVRVLCYTNASSVELFLNGKRIGERKYADKDLSKEGMFSWDVGYVPGTLKAVGYDAEGKEESQYEITTNLRPYALKAYLVGEEDTLNVGSGSVVQVAVEILDDNGRRVKLADNEITCTLSGDATLLGLEGSNNSDMTDYTDNVHRAYRGRLLAYIKIGNGGNGDVCAVFSSPLLKPVTMNLNINQ